MYTDYPIFCALYMYVCIIVGGVGRKGMREGGEREGGKEGGKITHDFMLQSYMYTCSMCSACTVCVQCWC